MLFSCLSIWIKVMGPAADLPSPPTAHDGLGLSYRSTIHACHGEGRGMVADSEKTAPLKQKWYQTSLFLAITIGIPFCIFKYLFGMLAVRAGTIHNSHFLLTFGQLVMVWAVIDLLMNMARMTPIPIVIMPVAWFGVPSCHAPITIGMATRMAPPSARVSLSKIDLKQ
jgi:hypothetical protein